MTRWAGGPSTGLAGRGAGEGAGEGPGPHDRAAAGPLVVVVGDALLDRTWEGTADRLCPDAVGPVVELRSETSSPGGAALTALAAAALGARVVFVTAIGDDDAGDLVRRRLGQVAEVIDLGLAGPTPEKIRVRCPAGTVTRLDRGCRDIAPVGDLRVDAAARARVVAALSSADAVLLSDYGRGLVTAVVDALRETDRSGGRVPLTSVPHAPSTHDGSVPVVWDPHPAGRRPDTVITLATPNLREAASVASSRVEPGPFVRAAARSASPDEPSPEPDGGDARAERAAVARAVAARWQCSVAVTCGADGAVVAPARHDGPPRARRDDASDGDVRWVTTIPATGDPCGAGDWFAAGATTALGRGAPIDEAVAAGCRAASAWVADGGSALLPDPTRSRLTVVATSGCFDVLHVGHLSMLRHARSLGDRLVVLVNSDDSVRRLKGHGRPVNGQDDRAALLAGLGCVDEVRIFDELTPCRALEALRPDVFVKGADYAGRALPEADVLSGWGGRLVFAPLVSGRSTTRVLRVAGEIAGRVG